MPAVATIDMVRDVVSTHRSQGSKIDVAFEQAGEILQVPPRWVRAVVRGEPAAVKPSRAARIHAGFVAWLRADTERLNQQIAQRLALLRAMETQDAHAMDCSEGAECMVGHSSENQKAPS